MLNKSNKLMTSLFSIVILIECILNFSNERTLIFYLSCILIIITINYISYILIWIVKNNLLIFFTNLYMFSSFYMGLLIGVYRFVWFWDILIHFFSGILLVKYGILICNYLTYNDLIKNKLILKTTIIFLYSSTIVLLWEIIEFICDKIFLTDYMNVKLTGVNDTMTDILADLIAILITLLIYIIKEKKRGIN